LASGDAAVSSIPAHAMGSISRNLQHSAEVTDRKTRAATPSLATRHLKTGRRRPRESCVQRSAPEAVSEPLLMVAVEEELPLALLARSSSSGPGSVEPEPRGADWWICACRSASASSAPAA